MHKLCSLKMLTPGSIVELPKEYASKEAETAVVLGLDYDSSRTKIRTEFLKQNGNEIITIATPALGEDTELAVVDDDKIKKSAIRAFVSNKFRLPGMGMTSGCDPEIFVEHGDGTIFPAWEFMPSEEESKKLAAEWLAKEWTRKYESGINGEFKSAMKGYHWDNPAAIYCPHHVPAYWDGAQAEFAPWAKGCLQTLHYGTREGLKAVLAYARAKDPLAKLTLRNVVELPAKVLQDTKMEYIQFRCGRSYNIYNDPGEGIPDAREYKFRCAGGHIHLGFNRTFTAPGIEQIVRGLDGVLGVAGVSLAAGIDNPERRHTYGRAGEFRLPAYGIEYRVLSNFWLAHPALSMLIFELARAVVRLAESGLYNLCWIASDEEIREVINNCDVHGAREILRRNAAVLAGMLHGLWSPYERNEAEETLVEKMRVQALRTIMNGIGDVVKDPYDIESNWKINDPDNWKQHCAGVGDNWRSFVGMMK
jgi:Phage phiEco32-like COOH.NH2 ligase-type 2